MMKLRILTLFTALILLFSLSACNKESPSPDSDTPVPVRVYTMNGTTGFGLAKLMSDAKAGAFSEEVYNFSVQSDVSVVTAALLNGDADIAAIPTNAASNLYQVTEGDVQILAINTLGCLYLLTNESETITSFSDLRGKTVYVPAQNPALIFSYLCQKNGLTVGTDITIDSTSYAAAANLKDTVAAGKIPIAVLPEPMVTIAKSTAAKNGTVLTVALDLTEEWNKVTAPGSLVQGCVVVRKAFSEAHPETVSRFLTAYKASIDYLSSDTDSAAQLIVDQGIFTSAPVAKQAIPKCNICFLAGKDMKTAMQTYLGVLYDLNPASVGGKLPDDAFYYGAE